MVYIAVVNSRGARRKRDNSQTPNNQSLPGTAVFRYRPGQADLVEIDPSNSLGGCDGGDGVNWEEVKNMLLAAKDDYGQLFEKGRPISNDVNLLLKKLSRTVPSNADFRNPQAMSQWAQAAALNAPMMGVVGKLPPTKFSQAHDLAQKNASLPIEKGGLGLPPNNTAMDRAKAMGFNDEFLHGSNQPLETVGLGLEKNGLYTTDNPRVADNFAMWRRTYSGANVSPLLINKGRNLEIDANYLPIRDIEKNYTGTMSDYDSVLFKNVMDDVPSAPDMTPSSNILRNINPKNVRSRFAAFDPMQKDSANILASILLGTLLYRNHGGDE